MSTSGKSGDNEKDKRIADPENKAFAEAMFAEMKRMMREELEAMHERIDRFEDRIPRNSNVNRTTHDNDEVDQPSDQEEEIENLLAGHNPRRNVRR